MGSSRVINLKLNVNLAYCTSNLKLHDTFIMINSEGCETGDLFGFLRVHEIK